MPAGVGNWYGSIIVNITILPLLDQPILKEEEKNTMAAIDKVLIVDDELDICYLLSGILKQRNFRTGFVNSLSDAVSALGAEVPSLLVLDNHLPDGFGLDFIPFVK